MVELLAGARPLEAVVELAHLALEARGEAVCDALFLLRPRLGVVVEPRLSTSTFGVDHLVHMDRPWRDRVSMASASSGSKRRVRSRLRSTLSSGVRAYRYPPLSNRPSPVRSKSRGAVVRRHDPPAPVELDDAQPGDVEQFREGRAQSAAL